MWRESHSYKVLNQAFENAGFDSNDAYRLAIYNIAKFYFGENCEYIEPLCGIISDYSIDYDCGDYEEITRTLIDLVNNGLVNERMIWNWSIDGDEILAIIDREIYKKNKY